MEPAKVRGVAICSTLACIAFCGCLRRPPPLPPLRPPPPEFQRRYHTLCLSTPLLPSDTPDADAKRKQLEDSLAASLQTAGFAVVPSEKTRGVWLDVLSSEGGYYDALTGERLEDRYVRTRQVALGQLHTRLGCDAEADSSVVMVLASWFNDSVEWDGATDSMRGAVGYGWVAALSIWVSMADLEGQEIYFGTGGIQVLQEFHGDFFHPREFADVAPSKILPPDRISLAVHLSLQRLNETADVTNGK